MRAQDLGKRRNLGRGCRAATRERLQRRDAKPFEKAGKDDSGGTPVERRQHLTVDVAEMVNAVSDPEGLRGRRQAMTSDRPARR